MSRARRSWTEANNKLYIEDDDYAWLPAEIITDEDGLPLVHPDAPKELSEFSDEGGALPLPSELQEWLHWIPIQVQLPPQWSETTMLHERSDGTTLAPRHSEMQWISRKSYPEGRLLLMNPSTKGKRDMADLPWLHQAAILYNLKDRHAHNQPYTRVGDILVAMNPFVWMHDLYSAKTRELYAQFLLWNQNDSADNGTSKSFGSLYDRLGCDPHVYETSCLAYRGLASSGRNQTIIVTGESGAGKTETVKILMSHLATLEHTRPGAKNDDDDAKEDEQNATTANPEVVERVLQSSPVFEAFGNAKTLRNDNSSRFGKFTRLQFQITRAPTKKEKNKALPFCILSGSACNTYLLEKSRVVSHSEGERNYHVFYQFLSAPNDFKKDIWSHLDDTTLESFDYLGDDEEWDLLGSPDEDKEEWSKTLEALKLFQFEGQQLKELLRALCVVLQLGNIQFQEDPASADSEEGGTVVANREELDKLVDITGVPAAELEQAMTMRIIQTGYDTVRVQLNPSVSKESCDALSKEIYARIFDLLVQSINDYTEQKDEGPTTELDIDPIKSGTISLLDIFGFERFKVNRFEQFCINYANEQLQYKYVLDNFNEVKEEYESEGIEIFDFSVVDNSGVLDLLGSRLGLIVSLNEECVRPKGNDESFVYKAKVVHGDHARLIDEKLHRKTEFGIKHFAGAVKYDATKFVERNTDKLADDLIVCASKSSNTIIKAQFEAIIERNKQEAAKVKPGQRRKKKSSLTVLQKFRVQLRDLMEHMEDTSTRYIRCIKPNDSKIPKRTDHNQTMRQLECAGLVTAILISRESFPNKLEYSILLERFACLLKPKDREYMATVETKPAANYMLSTLLIDMVEENPDGTVKAPFSCGNTKVYFRAGALEALEEQRLDYYTKRVIIVQRWVRRIQGQERFKRMKHAAIQMQRLARGRIERNRYKKKQKAATTLCAFARGIKGRELVQELKKERAATHIQNTWRTRSKTYQLRRMKEAASVIQKAFRNKEKRDDFSAKLAIAVEEARMDNKLLGLKEAVGNQPRAKGGLKQREVNEELLEDVEDMFEVLRKEIFVLRRKNADLKKELMEAEEDKRELIAHAESAEAAASSSRLQVAKLMKSNQLLVSEVQGQKHAMGNIRRSIRVDAGQRVEETMNLQKEHTRELKERDEQILALQKTVKTGRKSCDQEKQKLKDEIAKMEEAHVTQVLHLKDELRRTQDSHHDYLAKLMDVLETTHQSREEETARISAELMAVKEEKDSQIAALQQEVESLRRQAKQAGGGKLPPSEKDEEAEFKQAAGDIRRDVQRNSAAREQRSQKFQEVANRLVASVSPDNLVTITSSRRTRGKKMSMVEEESIRMKKMIRFLGDLYSLEETSQANFNFEALKKLERYGGGSASQPGLESRMKSLEAENKRLKEEVVQQGKCQRCESRDRRRMAKQRSNRSDGGHDITFTPPHL